MISYKDIFFKIKETLKEQSSFTGEEFDDVLEYFKHVGSSKLDDNDYYHLMVDIVFYSGMKANTVTSKRGIFRGYFDHYSKVYLYDEDKINEILSDKNMIRNKAKIKSCINNAKTFKNIIDKYGSFENYINSFKLTESSENLLLFRDEIMRRFGHIGPITSYQFMMDIGLPFLKPDRVIRRIFRRIGLIKYDDQLFETVIQGRKMSEETGLPIRYIDIILVKYGQMGRDDTFGLKDGICLEKNPKCELCGIRKYCEESEFL
ncbi:MULTISPECIES: DNA-3-methyladenine glycosylase I [Methanobacterium]|uniref:DNA-3-methyladenine glycosylase I n=1 Tax=Methanobacterium veterum TaxID=408577 RepID=A0A9E5DJS7_9EURY|nr:MULTISPECIES: DNA-3-methyladenine glycosylase I [Methanobacterium]MCZ3366532.1 DNA-3-methyladenine glycosylase I [Methanobacterium veterum]MCZ3371759.1 DNA-3-methyladenine glycosylase I [Methanobacterium veterum]